MSIGINIMYLNARGLENGTERRQLFELINNKKPDILFLQETHTTVEADTIWKHDWGKSESLHMVQVLEGLQMILANIYIYIYICTKVWWY